MAKSPRRLKSPRRNAPRQPAAAATGRSTPKAGTDVDISGRLDNLTRALEANTRQLAALEQRLQGLLTASPEFHLKGSIQPGSIAIGGAALEEAPAKQVQMEFKKQDGSPDDVRIVLDKKPKREVVLEPGEDEGKSRLRDVESEVDGVIDVKGEVGQTATVKISHALPDTLIITLDKGPQNKGVFTLKVKP